ncbi:replication endonuclease [Ewingella sp. CoE-038-23]|uniref:replication endonuclease n=1 Tax=Ewingella docleensis TaxID=3118588 RepID=UPI00336594F5
MAPTPPPSLSPGKPDSFAGAFVWNKPLAAIGVDMTPAPISPPSAPLEPHPAVTAHLDRLNKNGVNELEEGSQVLSDLLKTRAAIERSNYEREKATWSASPEGVEERFQKEPFFIRSPYQNKITWLRANRGTKHTNAFLMGTIKNALLRLDAVRKYHGVSTGHDSEFIAYYRPSYCHLAEFTKPRVKTLANEVAGRLNEMFTTAIEERGGDAAALPDEELLFIYRHMAVEVHALRVRPPYWKKLKPLFAPVELPPEPLDRAVFVSALSRLINADWWEHQLWRLRCDWRENQLRAIGSIHKRATPYISRDALADWLEQRRKNREFFKSHELDDGEGNRMSLESMVDASISNPSIRRHELMARMKGIEFVAQSRGDVGVFYTITCPSKYHATNASGHGNPKWNHSDVKQAQKYLTNLWARIGSKLNREGLRVYGFRVAEPHHDETPHWHLLLFMQPEERQAITSIMRGYAIKEDRAELGKRTGARFTAKRLDPKKGSATAYIAKYISKNIDGYALDGEKDHDTGKPLKETARLAMAWASRHRIRQYQPIGTPPVTVWRELRKLNNQLVGNLIKAESYKRGQKLLPDTAMDAVMSAADAGCFATYIMRQGGVLIPRDSYVVRLAYEDGKKPNAYGEITEKIFGIFSPRLGEDSRVCTRLKTWTIVAKQKTQPAAEQHEAMEILTLPDGPAVPWSSVNNSTGEENLNTIPAVEDRNVDDIAPDFEQFTDKDRRALLRRLRSEPAAPKKHENPFPEGNSMHEAWANAEEKAQEMARVRESKMINARDKASKIIDSAYTAGIHIDELTAMSLAMGGEITFNNRRYIASKDGDLFALGRGSKERSTALHQFIGRIKEATKKPA